MNSPHLPCMHRIGCGYIKSQDWRNLDRTCAAILLSNRIKLNELEAVSMQVRELNSNMRPFILDFHGPIKSRDTSSQGFLFSFHAQVRVHNIRLTVYVFGSVHIYTCQSCDKVYDDGRVDGKILSTVFHQDGTRRYETIWLSPWALTQVEKFSIERFGNHDPKHNIGCIWHHHPDFYQFNVGVFYLESQ